MSSPTVPSSAPASGLGKHEELPTPAEGECTCRPLWLRLRSNHGELVQPRGGCVNQCGYCAKLAAVENCEMLVLDALDGHAPTLLMILGTRTATLDMAAFATARQKLCRALRRRWPAAEYAYEVEFTTGYGPCSGGLRRPHWNWFWKGIPDEAVEQARELAVRIWCEHVDAEPHAQYVAAIDNAIGLTKYVTEHFMKASQRPPEGFTGQRFNCSVRYFGETTRAVARARAREAIRLKRELWKAAQCLATPTWDDELGDVVLIPAGGQEVEDLAQANYRFALATRWVLTNDRGARLGKQMLPDEQLPGRLRAHLQRACHPPGVAVTDAEGSAGADALAPGRR